MDTNTIVVAKRQYKVHQAREGHFLITLPSTWVRALGVKRKDVLTVAIVSDGSLKIEVVKKSDEPEPEGPSQPPTTSDAPVVPTKEESA
jgi:bifunctional DNA-binding transcriptional regulator/antitoxin component of YhaV-PrlF toxin-antitoxin module